MPSPDELFRAAVGCYQRGELAEAERVLRQVLAHQPEHADALHILGLIGYSAGQFAAAADLIERAIRIRPGDPDFHNNLGSMLSAMGRNDEAMAAYERAIALGNLSGAHRNIASVLAERGQVKRAIEHLHQAVKLESGYALAWAELGALLLRSGDPAGAREAAARSAILEPTLALAHGNLAAALHELGELDQAERAARQALALDGNLPEALNTLGNVLRDRRQLSEAIAVYERARVLRPQSGTFHGNLAVALLTAGRINDALAVFERAVALEPGDAWIWMNFSGALGAAGELERAIEAAERAIALRRDLPGAWCNIGIARRGQGRVDEAIEAFRAALRADERDIVSGSNLCYTLHFAAGVSGDDILAEHQHWAHVHEEPLLAKALPPPRASTDGRRLRIGYISPDYRDHPVGRAMLPVLEHHDRARCEVTCYSDTPAEDALTARLRGFAEHWRDTRALTDEQLAAQVRADGIDILLDLSLHMSLNRLPVFARRPAPVQATHMGYPATTGLRSIQWRITDPYLDPLGETESHNSEKLIRLPNSFWCYAGEKDLPVAPLPAETTGFLTFGSLNNPCKVSREAAELWAGVLKAVPGSRLLMLTSEKSGDSPHFRDLFERFGVAPERLSFLTRQSRREYLASYGRIDIGLDPLPYNGHMTSCDSFWMGVPVITVPGRMSVSRGGLSLLANLGMMELVAQSGGEFVEIARSLASDLPRLAEIRRGLRGRMRASPLCDGPAYARALEEIYRAMWATA